MITKSTVDRLIRFDGGGLPVLSMYVTLGYDGLDAIRTRLNSLITEIRPLTRDPSLDRRAQLSLRRDIERIEGEPGLGQGTIGAVAVFSCSEGDLFEVVTLPRAVRDRIVVDQTPYVRPMLAVLDEYHRACVLLVNRESARAWELYQTDLREIGKVQGQTLRKPDYGGWAGFAEHRVRNKADDLTKRHFRQTAALVGEIFRTRDYDLLIVGGKHEEVTVFLDFLPQRLRRKVTGTFNLDMDRATTEDIRESAGRVIADHEIDEERRLVQEIFESAAAGGNAALGIDDCLWGGTIAAVNTLLIQDDAEVPGVVCDESGWLARSGETCPLCGGPTRQTPDVLNDLAETVIDEGGSVEHVTADTPLKTVTTAAALRFSLPPRP